MFLRFPSIIVTQKCAVVRDKNAETVTAYNWKPSDNSHCADVIQERHPSGPNQAGQ